MDGAESQEAKQKTAGRRAKFCPKCGSHDIYWARGLAQLWSIWECRNCGYYGAFIVENGKMSQKLREDYAQKHRSTSNAGT